MLRRGFLAWEREKILGHWWQWWGNILSSYPGRKIAESSHAVACTDLRLLQLLPSPKMLLNTLDLRRHQKSKSSKSRTQLPRTADFICFLEMKIALPLVAAQDILSLVL